MIVVITYLGNVQKMSSCYCGENRSERERIFSWKTKSHDSSFGSEGYNYELCRRCRGLSVFSKDLKLTLKATDKIYKVDCQ